ncbi:hypothetical protein [uncultured Planococcus sp.]|uniref:hypothetical protein n=1 Tax=uncultured Planococcus sp. TaxID=337815 RepID=UPI0026374F95|nr:hypothetical protein [uncultured Planococcus sp.]
MHVKVERIYQLIYFGKTNIDVIDAVDALSRGFSKQTTLGTGAGHVTLGAFSMSQPFKTESGINAVICILPVSFHDNRDAPVYTKVDRVVLDFTVDDLQDFNTFNDVTMTGSTFDELAESTTMDGLTDAELGRAQHTQDITK